MNFKKHLFLILGLLFQLTLAQKETSLKKEIDSISQTQWNKTKLNLDSLSVLKVEKLNRTKPKDTIIIKETSVLRPLEEIPLTPFYIVHVETNQNWFFYGQNNLVINQSSYSNWNTGGNNNFGILGKINYKLSYKKRKHYFDNQLQLGYGFMASKGQATRKTDDYINLTSNYGYELGNYYYFSLGLQFLSQFANGYNYNLTPNPTPANRISRFMAPGYLNAGMGFSYNPNENFQLIFRPLNSKFTFVTDPLLQKAGRYGLERNGQSVRTELGAMLNILYRIKFFKDFTFDNQLNFFTNYLYHPERVDVFYGGVLTMRFNKFISTIVTLNLVYDHDQIQKLQMKQTLGIGFSYNIGTEFVEKDKNKKIKPFNTN